MKINKLIKILIAISILLFSVNISSAAGLEPPLKVAIANVLSGSGSLKWEGWSPVKTENIALFILSEYPAALLRLGASPKKNSE